MAPELEQLKYRWLNNWLFALQHHGIPRDAVAWAMNYSSQLARSMFRCAREATENGRQDKWSEVSEFLTALLSTIASETNSAGKLPKVGY